MNPNTPITYAEFAEDAIRCWEAGAGTIHAHNTSFDLLGENAYHDYMRTWEKVLQKHPDIPWYPTTCNNLRLTGDENGLEHVAFLNDNANARIACVNTGLTLFATGRDSDGHLGIVQAASLVISGATTVYVTENSDLLAPLFGTALVGLPAAFWLAVILAALLWALLRRTAVGQGMTAVGLNESGAIFAGLRTRWLKVLAFALSGLLAGVAGIMIIAQAGAASSFGLGFRPPHGAPPAPGRARCLHRQVEYDRVPRPGVRSSSEQEGAHG